MDGTTLEPELEQVGSGPRSSAVWFMTDQDTCLEMGE